LQHGARRPRDAEVAELHLALARHEDVRRRHVTVEDVEGKSVPPRMT
jgi:hypothetical protein